MNIKKVVRNVLLLFLVAAIVYVGDLFLGNPISRFRVTQHSESYLEKAYPGHLQLQMGEIYYDWYSGGGYEIKVISPVSRDVHFRLHYDRLGNFVQDTYDLAVASGHNTLTRLNAEYEAAVRNALQKISEETRCLAGLSAPDPYSGENVPLEEGLDPKQLALSEDYDVAVLGADYGYLVLTLWVTQEELTLEKAAEYLLAVKAAMSEAGVGFAGVELLLTVKDSSDPWLSLALEMVPIEGLVADNLPQFLQQYVLK